MQAPSEEKDEKLAELYRKTGRTEYINTLAERYVDSIYAAIRAMVLNQNAAEDLTQEVFLRLSRSLKSFKGQALFKTWLYRIMINVVKDYRRQACRRNEQPLEEIPEPVADGPDPSRQVMAGEEYTQAVKAMAALSPILREALILNVMEGMPVTVAAKAAGCGTATMYWRIHAARKELTSILKKPAK